MRLPINCLRQAERFDDRSQEDFGEFVLVIFIYRQDNDLP